MSTYYPNSFFERGRGSIYKSPTKAKPKNANEQAARTMQAAGIGSMGGKTTTTAAQKIQDRFRRETQKDSGSTYDEVPQTLTTGLGSKMVEPNMTMEEVETPNALTKAERIAEALKAASAAVGLSAPTPTQAYVYDPIKVYEAGMQRPVGSLAYDTMFPTQAMLDAVPGTSSKMTTTWGGRQQPLTVPDFNKFGSSIDNRPFYERLEDPYYSISQGSDVTPDRFNMAGSITAPELAYGKERITPTLPPQAAMGQNIPTMGSPAYSDAAVKSGVDDILLNLAEDYVIESGDTLSDIAKERGTTVEVLQKLNNISDADKDTIYTGDKLKVPPKDAENIIRVSTRGTSADSGEITSDAIDTSIRPKVRTGSTEKEIKQAQKILDSLGYKAGGADGKIGGGTKRAIRKFQKQHGLDVTGDLDPNTFKKITSDNVEKYPDPPKEDAEVIDFSESDFYIFKEAVAGKESGSHGYSTYAYDIPSANIKKGDPLKGGANKHYLGKYQMGKDALSDVGIDYNATSIKKYLNSPAQQEKAFKEYTENNHEKLTKESQAYREMTPKEKLAVLGYAHNQGATAAVEFLFTGVSGKDAFGTKGKEYINLVTDAFSRNQPMPRPRIRPLGIQ